MGYPAAILMNITVLICMALLIIILMLCVLTAKSHKSARITLPVISVTAVVMAAGFILNTSQYTDGLSGVFTNNADKSENQTVENLGSEYEIILDDILKSSYGDDYTLKRDGLTFEITTHTKGMRSCVDLALQGDQASVGGWNEITDKLTNVSKSYYDMLSEQDVNSILMTWIIADDTNPDNALFITANGIPVYNAVELPNENLSETN